MELLYQKQALRVLSPSLNKQLYSVNERLQLARFQQACELEAKRRKLVQLDRAKSIHLKKLLKERLERKLVGQELANLRQMYKHVNEHREVRKREFEKRDLMRQIRMHRDHCEQMVRERAETRAEQEPRRA